MRIAIFTETYLPQINGVVTHIKILKEGLEALGHTVLIVTADAKAHRHYIEDGVLHCPAHTLKRIYNMCLASPVSSARLHYLREFNPDIIHLHTEFSVGLSGLAIAKILKVPVVYTLHTMYDDYIYYIAPKPLVPLTRKLSHHYFRIFPQHTNVVTGPSKKCQEYTTEIGSDKRWRSSPTRSSWMPSILPPPPRNSGTKSATSWASRWTLPLPALSGAWAAKRASTFCCASGHRR